MATTSLIIPTRKGLYCPPADVYLDPQKGVAQAIISHAHADHMKSRHRQYIAHRDSLSLIRHRLGERAVAGFDYGETFEIKGVQFTFVPAGHIVGSVQVRISYQGETWGYTGDFKHYNDGVSTPWQPLVCDHYITESTFGSPEYVWPPVEAVIQDMIAWHRTNQQAGKQSMIAIYTLGKAQWLSNHLAAKGIRLYTHPYITQVHDLLRQQGHPIVHTTTVAERPLEGSFLDGIILVPPVILKKRWRPNPLYAQVATCTGWAAGTRLTRQQRRYDKHFILSDHADYPALCLAANKSQAKHIYLVHGQTKRFQQALAAGGFDHVTTY